MKETVTLELLTLLEGKVRAVGGYWSEAVGETYLEILSDLDDETARKIVRECVYQRPGKLDPADLYTLVRAQSKPKGESPMIGVFAQEDSPRSLPPGYLRGILTENWHRNHPGEPLPAFLDKHGAIDKIGKPMPTGIVLPDDDQENDDAGTD